MKKDDAFYLRLAYLIFACIVTYTLYKAFGTLGVQSGLSEKYDEIYAPSTMVASILLGVGSLLWLRGDHERHEYFLASVTEIRKVTWPSFPDTKRMTIVVCVVVAIFAVILAIFDLLWAKLLGLMLA